MNDGVSLTSIEHPRPKTIWARVYWYLRCLRGIKESSLVHTEIELDP